MDVNARHSTPLLGASINNISPPLKDMNTRLREYTRIPFADGWNFIDIRDEVY